MTNEKKVWIGRCPKCGIVRIEQQTKPTTCKVQKQIGPRSTRTCSQYLVEVRSTRG